MIIYLTLTSRFLSLRLLTGNISESLHEEVFIVRLKAEDSLVFIPQLLGDKYGNS